MIKHEKVDICQLIGDVVEISESLLVKGVKIVNEVQSMPMIVADSDRLMQIM